MSESTLRTDGSRAAQPVMGVRNHLHHFIYCPLAGLEITYAR